MGLCSQRSCGCSIVSSTLSITGSGTGVDPWQVEQPLSSAQLPYYTFASTAARDLALPAPAEGQNCWIQNLDEEHHYTGSGWRVWYRGLTSATPVLGGSITLGSGGFNTISYWIVQGQVTFSLRVALGTGGGISGNAVVNLPVGAAITPGVRVTGGGSFFDSSASTMWAMTWEIAGAQLNAYRHDGGGTYAINSASPFTWTAGDEFWAQGSYWAS